MCSLVPNGSDPDEPKDGMNPQKTPREAAETLERQNKTSSPPAEIEDIRSQTSDFNFWILDCGLWISAMQGWEIPACPGWRWLAWKDHRPYFFIMVFSGCSLGLPQQQIHKDHNGLNTKQILYRECRGPFIMSVD